MDYIEQCRYFEAFIDVSFEHYIAFKRRLGVWGDEVEIQAICELYDIPFIIFTYGGSNKRYHHEKAES